MKKTQSKVLSLFPKNGRIYKKNLVELCRQNGIARKDYEAGIRELLEKNIISSHETLVDLVDYAVVLYICEYEILGHDGECVYLSEKEDDNIND